MVIPKSFDSIPSQIRKKRILVSTEGMRTEPQYFEHLNKLYGAPIVEPIPRDSKSAPKHVLEAMKVFVSENKVVGNIELWILVDIDDHPVVQFEDIHAWCVKNPEYQFAISNPCFELWLILHHENKNSFKDHKECKSYFKSNYGNRRNIPRYDWLNFSDVKSAYDRAKQLDTTDASGWPIESGCTTVYRVVENYISYESDV